MGDGVTEADGTDEGNPSVARPTIDGLTGIRIVAATWVLAEHFSGPLFALLPVSRHATAWIASGYLGVEVFFVLSGFIISYNYADRLKRWNGQAYRQFLTLRFARLYPVHLITLLAVGALVLGARAVNFELNTQSKYGPLSFVMNVLMFQAVPPAEAWNAPAWSISAEAGAYVAFPLLAWLLIRATTRFRALAGVLAGLTFTLVSVWLIALSGYLSDTPYPGTWVRVVGEFTAGCFLWAYWQRFGRRGPTWDLVAVGAFLGAGVILWQTQPVGPRNFLALPLLALLVVAVASSTGVVARVMGCRWMQYGGRISYSLYMTHVIVLMIVGKILRWDDFVDAALPVRLAILGVYFGVVIGVAAATYHWVEVPGRMLIRRRVGVRRRPVEASVTS